jgi:hypothetical protein
MNIGTSKRGEAIPTTKDQIMRIKEPKNQIMRIEEPGNQIMRIEVKIMKIEEPEM